MKRFAADSLGLTPETPRREAMARLIGAFTAAGIPDPAWDARLLLCAAAEIGQSALIREPEAPLDEPGAERLAAYAARRIAREPVTRILGTRGFWSLDLDVEPGVLDPRPDSEALIDAALRVLGERQNDPLRIADLGSGSGALLCALLEVFENATGAAVDISPRACQLTARNLRRSGLLARARVVEGDWASLPPEAFDLVVCNPPYIRSDVISTLDPEVRDYDPRLALDGGADGLDAYRSLAGTLPGLLARGGIAIIELGFDQAQSARDLFLAAGFGVTGTQRDLAGVERALILKGPAAE